MGPVPTGKRVYLDKVNHSKSTNMYDCSDDRNVQERLFYRRHTSDYWNKAGVEYVPPAITKPIEKRHSFVHNIVANKTKSNVQFVEDILSKEVLTANKRKILI